MRHTHYVIPGVSDMPYAPSTARSTISFRWPWWTAGGLVMLLTAVLSLAGLSTAPIEGHEVFVVQTAKEMRQRGDWVLPYYQGEPRLNKPPLNYWLAAGVSILAGDRDVLPWHGRFVSSLGGLLMVLMTLWAGTLLMNRSLGITAGLLAATSVGYLMFSHDGRPDMLYAGLCTAMIPLWLWTWKSINHHLHTRAAIGTCGMYIALALATLSKGPHIPLLFLGAFILITFLRERATQQASWGVYAQASPWRTCLKIFRPLTGLLLATLLIAPWWLAIYARIGDELFNTQLAGKRYGMSLWSIANPYYFYRGLVVILPWCLLWVFAGVTLFNKSRQGRAARMMFTVVIITLIALSFAHGKRLVYVLPLLCPLFILIALGAQQLAIEVRQHGTLKNTFHFWHTGVYTLITVLMIGITSTIHAQRLLAQGQMWVPLAGIAGTLITAGLVLYFSNPQVRRSQRAEHALSVATRATPLTAIRGAALIFAWFLLVANIAATTASAGRWKEKPDTNTARLVMPAQAEFHDAR